jgi:hypothetical protein
MHFVTIYVYHQTKILLRQIHSKESCFRVKLLRYQSFTLTHWARFSFLRKFFQDVIFMGSSLLVIALNDLFVISYRLFIVLFFVSSHNEPFCSDQLNNRSSYFFVLFHIIRSMCEKKKEIPSLFSLILARCPKTLCWLLPENQATKTKRSEPGNSKKIKTFCSDCEKFFFCLDCFTEKHFAMQ